jgi:hypothetical protein
MFGKSGSILLSIGNLPPQVSRKVLKAHVQRVIDALDGSSFRFTRAICSCSIVRLTNPTTGFVSHQGLVSVQPARLALRVIDALDGEPLRGVKLRVSRYRHGSFPVSSSKPLVSMSDLLGVGDSDHPAQTVPLRLDLVSNTGMHKAGGTPKARDKAAGILAH